MILTEEQKSILYRYLGQGPIDKASIIICGNEFGTANSRGQMEQSINKFVNDFKTRKLLQIGEGFSIIDIESPPVSSTFLQFISRLLLALNYKDDRFFNELSDEGKIFLNKFIMNDLYRTNSAIINIKPLPRSTERVWNYDNVSENDYSRKFNFMLTYPQTDEYKEIRIKCLKDAFNMAKDALIIGSGDKHNKKAFFETIYPEIKFSEHVLTEKLKIYFSKYPKIILSNYFDSRNGIGLVGLKEIYNFISKNSLL